MLFVVHKGRHARVSCPNSKTISVMWLGLGGHADGAAGDAGPTVRLGVEDESAADDAVVAIEVENIVTLVNRGLALVVSVGRSEITEETREGSISIVVLSVGLVMASG